MEAAMAAQTEAAPARCGDCGKGTPVALVKTPRGRVAKCDACLGFIPEERPSPLI